uniref:Transposase n=1 Tax=Ascaris lumbricoides TaxID=6252 RepID=A0A0M3IUW3_ASCLU
MNVYNEHYLRKEVKKLKSVNKDLATQLERFITNRLLLNRRLNALRLRTLNFICICGCVVT